MMNANAVPKTAIGNQGSLKKVRSRKVYRDTGIPEIMANIKRSRQDHSNKSLRGNFFGVHRFVFVITAMKITNLPGVLLIE